ncbi:MAG: UDP-N-acetylmuramoyl-L-alanyl-D-glutamate--2,6-diaminopimelate ligase [Ginsengibacter sp.]
MPSLQNILYNVKVISLNGSTDVEVSSLQIDSRKVESNSCFIAIKGNAIDGHSHIESAIEKGAMSVICEILPDETKKDINYVKVENTSVAAGIMAANFYDNPSKKLQLVGVTGTNGKTTIATVLFRLFSSLGFKCGLISTVQNQIEDQIIPTAHTTPDPISLNGLLHDMTSVGCQYAFMEVSSHAIHQNRISGLQFKGALFSNITHDHLDYHKTFDEYIRVKKSFFDNLPSTAFALSNADDKRGNVMLQNTKASRHLYSLKTVAEFKGKILENSLSGLLMTINNTEVHFKMIGTFNAYNLLAVFGAAVLLGQNKLDILQHLSKLKSAEGRFDYINSPKNKIIGIVDYAHTPDALLNVLTTIKSLRNGPEKIITVVGCGGDRDKTKRPVMAEVCCEHSDKIIFTSDNPRSEDPSEIIKEMEAGVKVTCRKKCISIVDRREAIKTAVSLCDVGDIILVAGKGHEKYQEINGVKSHFDDKEVLNEVFSLLEK